MLHAVRLEVGDQRGPAVGVVGDALHVGLGVQGEVEVEFAGIDPGDGFGMLGHLRRPILAMRTGRSFNHPGPMKRATAIRLRISPEG
ncbi:hypothetical protein [Methylorubrum sp. SB2]|uniref:hypothetical protein n=1 Tax=Methylorubrum subtropicum TaxID=3138812 RepID=UPI00313C1804